MNKYLITIIAIFAIFLVSGCAQKVKEPPMPSVMQEPQETEPLEVIEVTEPEENNEPELIVVSQEYIVLIKDLTVNPKETVLNVGDSVVFSIEGTRPHNLIIEDPKERTTNVLGRLEPGDKFSQTMEESGTFVFRDIFSGAVTGTIIVEE